MVASGCSLRYLFREHASPVDMNPQKPPQERSVNRQVFLLLMLVAFVTPSQGQHFSPLLNPKLRDLLHEVLSGEIAKDHVIQISQYHRVQGSRGYRQSAEYVLGQLHRYGFTDADAYIESAPSDGKIVYQTWQSPSGWDIESAELRMVEPYDERIVGYPEVAMSLITYSNPGDVTAEVVWVGVGTSDADYVGKDVRGKFVLATGYGGEVHRNAVLKHGAAAVVVFLDDDRAKEYPDMLAYTGMWPRTEELDGVTFGFNITNRQGERLRDMLLAGERVVLSGMATGIGLEPYFMDAVVARIPGTDPAGEELIICGHLDHPKESANDNGSGSGAMLDIARGIKALIDTGRMPRPARSIRLLWIAEFYGIMAYVDAHPEMTGPELGGQFLAGMNLDMVGEHLELLHSRMHLTRVPSSIPTVLNDVVANMAEMVDAMDVRTPRGSKTAFNYRVTPYSGGSDHMILIDRKIPAMMLGHSDYTHHTSEDTPDKVDPVELERSEIITAATMLFLADMSVEQAVDLAYLVGANSAERLGSAARRVRGLLGPAADTEAAWFEVENTMAHAGVWEREAIGSVLQFNDDNRVIEAVQLNQRQLEQQAEALLVALRAEANAAGISTRSRPAYPDDDRVPKRLTRGPLGSGLPASQLAAEDAAWYSSPDFPLRGNMPFELLNFIDGERTVTDVRNALSAEFVPVPTGSVARYLNHLVQVGVVEW